MSGIATSNKWFTYVLRSDKDGGLYIGMAMNVEERVKQHNRGYNASTRLRAPFTLIYSEAYESSSKAREREKFLKSGKGREFLKSCTKV